MLHPCALLIALAAQAPEPPLEPLSDPAPDPLALLNQAADARAQKDAGRCEEQAAAALHTGALDVEQAARAWALRGACLALAGAGDKARRCYAVALRVKPDMAAVDDDAFRAAKHELPAQAFAFRAARVPEPADTVEVEILGDDLRLAANAVLVRGGEELARFPLSADAAKHRVTGLGAGPLSAFLLDRYGNRVAHVDVATEPEHVITPPPATAGPAPTVLTTLGATALGAGLVGIVVSGIGVAALGDKALDDGQLWLVGVGASTGLFLVGASLVVVDQGL